MRVCVAIDEWKIPRGAIVSMRCNTRLPVRSLSVCVCWLHGSRGAQASFLESYQVQHEAVALVRTDFSVTRTALQRLLDEGRIPNMYYSELFADDGAMVAIAVRDTRGR